MLIAIIAIIILLIVWNVVLTIKVISLNKQIRQLRNRSPVYVPEPRY